MSAYGNPMCNQGYPESSASVGKYRPLQPMSVKEKAWIIILAMISIPFSLVVFFYAYGLFFGALTFFLTPACSGLVFSLSIEDSCRCYKKDSLIIFLESLGFGVFGSACCAMLTIFFLYFTGMGHDQLVLTRSIFWSVVVVSGVATTTGVYAVLENE